MVRRKTSTRKVAKKVVRTGPEWYSKKIDDETRLRTRVALAALAYEAYQSPFISDGEFDSLCQKVDLSIDTRRPDLDAWFRSEFDPSTGSWIWSHPDRTTLETIFLRQFKRVVD